MSEGIILQKKFVEKKRRPVQYRCLACGSLTAHADEGAKVISISCNSPVKSSCRVTLHEKVKGV
ncbi:hypothetical protein LCGC14_1026800 [marine sediment metagenome]|uniref:Uncharacterized protein n=1 Tax=marine sediment metagenome TaxID=412755 RepID=A0A0F9R1Q2_9ZZZZ